MPIRHCSYPYKPSYEGDYNTQVCQKDDGELSGEECERCGFWYCGYHTQILNRRKVCIYCIIDEEPNINVAMHCSFHDRNGDRCENKIEYDDAIHDQTIKCKDFEIGGECDFFGEWDNESQSYEDHYTFSDGWEKCSKCEFAFCKDHSNFLKFGVCFYCEM